MPIDPELRPSNLWLRPRDQRPVAIIVGCALAVLGLSWLRHGGHRGRLIDVDRAPPLVAQFQVDVNRADWPELTQLPGVGETLAMRVIAEREENGRFRTVEDLGRVRGFGARTLERIRPYVAPIPSDAGVASR